MTLGIKFIYSIFAVCATVNFPWLIDSLDLYTQAVYTQVADSSFAGFFTGKGSNMMFSV